MPPRNGEGRAAHKRGPQPLALLTSASVGESVPRRVRQAEVTDLQVWRHTRSLQLTSSVQVPCVGVCTCWGAPLGGWSA